MMAGRRPTLTGRLARQGARGLRFGELAMSEIAEVPEHFGPIAADFYAAAGSELAAAGMLSRMDVVLIEMGARAYERWLVLDAAIVEAGRLALEHQPNAAYALIAGETGNKGFMSGEAQARSAAAKELRQCLSELGFTPAARIRSAGAAQSNFFEAGLLDAPAEDGARVDPYAPNIVQFRGGDA